jgi:spore maturation protein SpmB|tara:strand:+ start:236 stop:454 length:219 start_codon:yes stop_codon:yes gene_type:complete
LIDRLLGVDEQSLAYDLSRAHSADVFFIKVRAWMWGTISTVAFFLIGNILGSFGVDLLGSALDSIKEGLGMN